MPKEFVSSNDLHEDELEKMFEKVENGQMIEVDGCFNNDCYVSVIHDPLDPSGARLKTQKRVNRVKRLVELSKGRKSKTYRDFS